MNQTISTDDLFKIIGNLHVQLQVAQGYIAQLEQQLAEAKKNDTGKQPKSDKNK